MGVDLFTRFTNKAVRCWNASYYWRLLLLNVKVAVARFAVRLSASTMNETRNYANNQYEWLFIYGSYHIVPHASLINLFLTYIWRSLLRIITRAITHAVTVTAVSKTAAEMVTPTEEAIAKAILSESFGFGVRCFDGIHITTEVYGATKPVVTLIPRMVQKSMHCNHKYI